jgi:hypothetical protein
MRDLIRLFVIVAKAAVIVVGGAYALVLATMAFRTDGDARPTVGILIGLGAAFLPTVVAIWWISRTLRTVFQRREARAISTAFGVFAPVSLGVALGLSPIAGGYGEFVGHRPVFGLVGLLLGTAMVTALLSFLVCATVLRVTRLRISLEEQWRFQ